MLFVLWNAFAFPSVGMVVLVEPKSTVSRFVSSLKVSFPIAVTVSGMVIVLRLVQPLNMETHVIVVRLAGSVTEVSDEQRSQVPPLFPVIDVIPSPKSIDVRPEQAWNAACPSVVTVSGRATEVKPVHLAKQNGPILVKVDGIVIDVKLLQPLKQLSEVEVTPFSNITEVKLVQSLNAKVPKVTLLGMLIEVNLLLPNALEPTLKLPVPKEIEVN